MSFDIVQKPLESAKKTFFCPCVKNESPAADLVSLEFFWPGPEPRAGQFFMIKPRRSGIFLGRPISVAGWEFTRRGAEEEGGVILRFLIALRGSGSRELSSLQPGEEAELIGPLGNCWAEVKFDGKGPVALVAGGIGIAPLLAYTQKLNNEKSYDFYAGFKTASDGAALVLRDEIKPRSLVFSTEDGSGGGKGRITDFFDPSAYSAVFACGPEPMLQAVAIVCKAAGVPCFINMERYMACGVGACLGCTVKTVNGNRSCCTDGPIFNSEEVCFDG